MIRVPPPPAHTVATLAQFLRAHVEAAGATGVVLGLSGGIDSALAARLARDALGAARVLGVLLPDAAYPSALRAETEAYARSLGVEIRVVEIEPLEAAFHRVLPEVEEAAAWGNVKARLRMIVLYAVARERRALVLGTGNKSELLLGYFTKYGDGGVDLLPLGDLYKTQVQSLAASLDLPAPIRDRPPTAGLWPGQTDEGELGRPYAVLDAVLCGLEQLLPPEEIARRTGLARPDVAAIEARVLAHRHKRRLPPIPKLSLRTVGVDWRD
jgi:NAD+ synthase